jgi:hypothetical protein
MKNIEIKRKRANSEAKSKIEQKKIIQSSILKLSNVINPKESTLGITHLKLSKLQSKESLDLGESQVTVYADDNKEQENNINNDNNIDRKEENIINDNNKINNEEKLENSINENRLNEHFETCHLCLKKGNDFNSDEIYCIPIIRNKKKKSVLQKFGLFKKPKYDLVNYKIFFDECFIYLSKDIVIDKKNTNKRRINNVLKIKNIINFNTKKEQNNYFVTIDIYNKNGVLKNKEFFVEEKYFEYFNKEINKSLELYGGLYMKSKKL